MQNVVRGSGHFDPRHELDRLAPTSAISAKLATAAEVAGLVDIARREIPGVNASESGLAQFLQFDPESIFAFQRGGKLLGGIAFLYLNCRGHDALLLDDIDLKNPGLEYLARPDEKAAAIYVWALAGYGRAVVGLGNVAHYLRRPRFAGADYFAQPSSKKGRDLLIALGFRPAPSFRRDLWCYERPWRRVAPIMPAPIVSVWSLADARH
jgi:hypothetical protein